MKEWFTLLAEYVPDLPSDVYGEGEYMQAFEKEIADLLGHEAAVFMPSGTMAQQIALRIWAESRQNFSVAMHPLSHLDTAEHFSYQFIHNLKRIQFGIPEFGDRLLTTKDFQNLKETPGSILLELPQRFLGGYLPPWEDLQVTVQWARDHDIPIHLDGARLWESQPYYSEKSLADIASLFDSVYVSFYKGLGGITGSMLLGPQSFIEEAKVWLRRMGGNLRAQFSFVASAKWGVENNLPKMQQYHERAKALAKIINTFPNFSTSPQVPHTNMFLIFLPGDPAKVKSILLEASRECGVFFFGGLRASQHPQYSFFEVNILNQGLDLDLEKFKELMQVLADKLV